MAKKIRQVISTGICSYCGKALDRVSKVGQCSCPKTVMMSPLDSACKRAVRNLLTRNSA